MGDGAVHDGAGAAGEEVGSVLRVEGLLLVLAVVSLVETRLVRGMQAGLTLLAVDVRVTGGPAP